MKELSRSWKIGILEPSYLVLVLLLSLLFGLSPKDCKISLRLFCIATFDLKVSIKVFSFNTFDCPRVSSVLRIRTLIGQIVQSALKLSIFFCVLN